MMPLKRPGFFWPYDSIEDMFVGKVLPEFGLVPSRWQFVLPVWRFYHAENRDLVPPDFAQPTYDDSGWDEVDVPSVWQQEGRGIASNLLYNAAERDETQSRFRKTIREKLAVFAGSDVDDDVGVYRTWITVPAAYLERAVYFSCSGIRGRFDLFVNGRHVTSSGAWYTPKRVLISPFLNGEHNIIAILVFRLDGDRRGRIRRENGTFGFSGIFRIPEIVAEPFLEISGARLFTEWMETEAETDTANPVPPIADEADLADITEAQASVPSVSSVFRSGRRNGRIRMKLQLTNHADFPVRVKVAYNLIEVRDEYDLYHLPAHPVSVTMGLSAAVPPVSDVMLGTEILARSVLPWSDTMPSLYDLVLTVSDSEDRVISVKKLRFGFRTSGSADRIFHINDVALPLRTVRYFQFDPEGGLAVPADRLRQDIILMKQAGVNAVLTAHIPSDPLFYLMCDQYGMYVISQADPSRMFDMIESLGSHPSIVFWSFSPLHFEEGKLADLKNKLMEADETRPFYCEKDRSSVLSDIPPFPCEAGVLFGDWSDICIDRRTLQSKLEPGKTAFDFQPGRAKRDTDSADFRWIHQGDLEEYHEKMDVAIAQGIVGADRVPHPVYHEIRKQCESLKFIASPDNPANLFLQNAHPIGWTRDLDVYWQLLLGGLRIRGGHGVIGSIPPLGQQEILFPFTVADYLTPEWLRQNPQFAAISDAAQSRELVLDIRACLLEDTAYAPKGFEMAFYQQVLTESTADGVKTERREAEVSGSGASSIIPAVPAIEEPPERSGIAALAGRSSARFAVSVLTRPTGLLVEGKNTTISFSRKSGGLSSFSAGGLEMLSGSIQPSFFRAATNSDRSDQSFILAATVFSKETDWRTIQQSLEFRRFHYEMAGEAFSLVAHYRSFAFKGDVLVQYILGPEGKLEVTLAFRPRYDILRCGFRLRIPAENRFISWYGRGFHEAYPDRKESARLGFYEAEPAELYHEYARPQENGSHCDTQCLLVTDGIGKGMRITAADGGRFSFTAIPYAPEDLDDHQHQEELHAGSEYELFLDFYQKEIERTGRESHRLEKNREYRGSFIIESWESKAQSEP